MREGSHLKFKPDSCTVKLMVTFFLKQNVSGLYSIWMKQSPLLKITTEIGKRIASRHVNGPCLKIHASLLCCLTNPCQLMNHNVIFQL